MRGEPPITPNPRSPYDSPTDTLLLVALGLALAASGLVWLAAQVAALCFGAHHPVHLGLSDMPGVLFQLAEHPADPRLAFPAAARAALPGPVGATPAWSSPCSRQRRCWCWWRRCDLDGPAAGERGGRQAGSSARCGFGGVLGHGGSSLVAAPASAG